jgi:hypothetical protein
MKTYTAEYNIRFTDWDKIPSVSDFSLPWNNTPVPVTSFQAFHNGLYLHFRFIAHTDKPLVYVKENLKLEVTRSERVEIFLRSDPEMKPYYCLEIDPHGRVLDYKADLYRLFDYNWSWPEKLQIQAIIHPDHYMVCGKLSLAVLNSLKLIRDNRLEVGLFRGNCKSLNGDKAQMDWISWIKPDAPKPDFHIPSAFGTILLKDHLL